MATLFGDVLPILYLFFIIGPIGFTKFSIALEYESLDVCPGVGCKNADWGVFLFIS